MADVKVEKQQQQSQQQQEQGRAMERRGGGGMMARRGEFFPSELFTLSPFAMMRRLSEEMDRAFGSSFGLFRGAGQEYMPPVEIREENNNIVICADVPGINKEDIHVEATEDGLVIEGERKREQQESRGGMQRSERMYGHFYRLIPLPEGADVDKASAQFKDGVLEVRVPLSQQEQKRREIPINKG
jgi:HSP20 family protein